MCQLSVPSCQTTCIITLADLLFFIMHRTHEETFDHFTEKQKITVKTEIFKLIKVVEKYFPNDLKLSEYLK